MDDTDASGDARKVIQGESLTPITTALDGNEHILFQGFSSLTGNYWLGGLAIYKPKRSVTSLGAYTHEDDVAMVDDLSCRFITHTTFDASVASIASLNSASHAESGAVLVGLDDGSIQLVTIPDVRTILASPKFSPKALTCNAATYHDWPIRKVTCSKTSNPSSWFVSLDTSGILKLWDSNRLMPTVSWSIWSSSWPHSGQALLPDLTILSDGEPDHLVMATLNPCDSLRQLVIWDTRVDTLTKPRLGQCSPMGSSETKLNPPTSITALSAQHIVLGTFDGFLHLFDTRQLAHEMTTVPAFPELDCPAGATKPSNEQHCPIRKARRPEVEASELNAHEVQVTLLIDGLKPPRRGLLGCVSSSCSGGFQSDSGSMNQARFREQLRNGILTIELGEFTLNMKCELTDPIMTYEYTVRQFPTKIMPTFSLYKIKNNQVILRLKKAAGSDSWTGALAVKGLDQA